MDQQTQVPPSSGPAESQRLVAVLTRVVRRICPRFLAGEQDDLVQNAVVRIMRKRAGNEESLPLGASYIWKVAHSVVMDEIRRRRRHPEVELQATPQTEPVSRQPGPEHDHERATMRAAIAAGLQGLGADRRWAVLLSLYGFSLKDSAGMLGWSTKRVDNQRYQGLRELRAYLRDRGFEP